MASQTYLIVRSKDLVVLAVRWDGFEVHRPVPPAVLPKLVATGAAPTVTVTFPPQAILEQTAVHAFHTEGLVHSDSRLTGVSELVFQIDRGTAIDLSVESMLDALAHRGSLSRVSPSRVEMPWGLRLAPRPQTSTTVVISDHAARPVAVTGSDVVGLWNARLRASDGSPVDARLEISPQLVSESDIPAEGLFDFSPLRGWRRKIVERSAGESLPKATRLELSALGGSLSASANWNFASWNHEMVHGRDQKVQVVAQGRLWPFGHRVIYQDFTGRALVPVHATSGTGHVAGLLTPAHGDA
jgi:hypothetical protein